MKFIAVFEYWSRDGIQFEICIQIVFIIYYGQYAGVQFEIRTYT